MHAVSRNALRLAVFARDFRVFVEELAAELNPRIEHGINLPPALKDEVAVLLRRAEEAVARVGNGRADDAAVFDRVLRLAAVLLPAVECFAVEQRLPLWLGRVSCTKKLSFRDDNEQGTGASQQANVAMQHRWILSISRAGVE